jgi:hypothetical protein
MKQQKKTSGEQLLDALKKAKKIVGYVRLNSYTEFLVPIPKKVALAEIKDKLTKPGPSSRPTAKFSFNLDEEDGTLWLLG